MASTTYQVNMRDCEEESILLIEQHCLRMCMSKFMRENVSVPLELLSDLKNTPKEIVEFYKLNQKMLGEWMIEFPEKFKDVIQDLYDYYLIE